MAFVKVSISKPPLDPGDIALPLSEEITSVIDGLKGKDREATVVQVNQSEPFYWSVDGGHVSDTTPSIASVDVYVSEGSLKKAQFESIISGLHEVLENHLSPIHEESYVLVHEFPDRSWGFGGKSLHKRNASDSKRTA